MRYLTLFLVLLLFAGIVEARAECFSAQNFYLRYYSYDNGDVDESFGGNFLAQAVFASLDLNSWLRLGGGFAASDWAIGAEENPDISQFFYFCGLTVEPYIPLSEQFILSMPILVGTGQYEFENLHQSNGSREYQAEIYQSSFFCIDTHLELMWEFDTFTGLGIEAGYSFFIHKEKEFTGSPYVGLGIYFGIL
ncbi:hypothetical protein K8R78_05165 [bacterium]|nr:hypothetical protein [bacterium]